MVSGIVALGFAAAIGFAVAVLVRDLWGEKQAEQSFWMALSGFVLLTLYIAFAAKELVSSSYGGNFLMFLIALEVGCISYMVGATLSLIGTSFRISTRRR